MTDVLVYSFNAVAPIIGLILGVISTIYYAMAIGQMLQTGYFNEILDMM